MHEREKDAAEIDVLAATVNAEAARIVALAEARARSAQDCRLISGHGNTIELAQALAKHERDEQLAYDMATRSTADASVGYYGVGIDKALDEKNAIKKPLMLHLAGDDRFVPPDDRSELRCLGGLDV